MSQIDGELMYHTACISCDSSDAMAVYKKIDDEGNETADAFCFSCNKYHSAEQVEEAGVKQIDVSKKKVYIFDPAEIQSIPFRGWKDRNITKATSAKYNVHTEVGENHKVIARYYPSTKDGKVVGYKKRTHDKKFIGLGSTKATNELFGQSVFEAGQKYLVITTGEEDAMSFAEALRSENSNGQEYWTPCVSVTCGDGSIIKQFKANFNYINSFEKVILAFDSDEPGQRYLEEAARLLSPGKAYIAKFPSGYKDASDLLSEGKVHELKQVFWKAVPFSRVDVLHLEQMWEDFESEDNNVKIPFPPSWSHLNEMTNGGMEKGEITVIGALTSIGKGQPVWENVVTPTGYRKVGDIVVGDKLIGSQGKPITVTGVFPQGLKNIFKITLNDDSVTYCDDQHLWAWRSEYEHREGKKFRVTNVQSMIEHMNSNILRNKVMLPPNPVVEFHSKALPLDPWLLGVIIGDCGTTEPTIILTNTEKDIIDRVIQKIEPHDCYLTKSGEIGYRIVSKNSSRTVMNPITKIVSDLGLMKCKSKDKFIPEIYLVSSAEQRLNLLRGLFDTDGSVVKNTANLEYSTSSEKLAQQVKWLCRSLGMTARIVERESFYKKDGVRIQTENSFRVFIKCNDVLCFSSDKHKSRFKQGNTIARNYVKSIEPVGKDETVCFKVDAEDELYLTNDFIVTHNTTIVNNLVYHLIENTKFKVGAMYLEGTKRETVRDLLSLDAGVNLRIKKREEIDIEFLKKRFFENLVKKNQFVYVDHQGSISTSEIFDKLNYLAKAEGCDVIVIDPIQAGVNSSDNGAIIEFMDTLLKFAKETDTCIVAISHMRKPSEDNPHNVTEYQLMGSASINQIAFNTILISRDKLNPDPNKKSATKLQLVKCRRTGNTGEAGWLRYDPETTHLFATSNPYAEDDVSTSEAKEIINNPTPLLTREVDF